MATIAEENKKILRRAMDVVVGVDFEYMDAPTYEFSGYYSGSSKILNADPENITLMDLSGGGFLNDGRAEPLSDETPGYLSVIGQPMVINLTKPSGVFSTITTVVGAVDGAFKSWNTRYYTNTARITIPASNSRVRIVRLIAGLSLLFNKNALTSCTLQLRGVETKLDNPELQLSEIEFTVKEESARLSLYPFANVNEVVAALQEGTIYYAAGYPGDMSPVRKFYVADVPDITDGQVTIRGEDATRFLPESFPGRLIGNNVMSGGGVRRYVAMLDELLTNAGIEHETANFPNVWPYNNGDAIWVGNDVTPRGLIAQAVNMIRSKEIPFGDVYMQIVANYVDAGRPRLWTNQQQPIKVLDDISRPRVDVEPRVKSIKYGNVVADAQGSAKAIETINVKGAVIRTTSDPYYSFSASSGTIEKLSPYSYKLTANGSVTVRGVPIDFYVEDSPFIYETGNYYGVDIDLGDFNRVLTTDLDESASMTFDSHNAGELVTRGRVLYTFDYRGDPNLQPRDYIRADVKGNGSLTDMTIDHIEIRHENGGMISTITAREGFI